MSITAWKIKTAPTVLLAPLAKLGRAVFWCDQPLKLGKYLVPILREISNDAGVGEKFADANHVNSLLRTEDQVCGEAENPDYSDCPTRSQIRAAGALLGWSQQLSRPHMQAFESRPSSLG
jgi:hypothetical protein